MIEAGALRRAEFGRKMDLPWSRSIRCGLGRSYHVGCIVLPDASLSS